MIDNMKNIEELIAHLPYRASFYDNNLRLIYSNNRSDGSFFPENESEKLPEWIWQNLHQIPERVLHLQIPTDSFDAILIQTYQLISDSSGKSLGVITYIQDLKPLLSSYLNETGQAIVAWSDTTSGPSIGNDL
ncbi:sodium transporter [Streptococcus gallolyticus]|uniref:sodium transporter n=1 Tax=Streptococcus gallolyticus TaxID=315405 RepID=UPI0022840BE2|nr:sodium transporter [Streptococcus gallolyticus]MCY7187415.1 sodium transporter [Streptococcus gallolyticus subsp. gallolyticus]